MLHHITLWVFLLVAAVATVLVRLGPDRTLVGADVLPSTPPVRLAWNPGVLELAQPALAIALMLALALGGVGLAAMIAGFVVKTPTWAWLA